jgi:hypothetical protein
MVLTSTLLLTVGLCLAITPLGPRAFLGALAAASNVGPAEPVGIGVSLVRLLGATLACVGLVAWCVRGITNPEAQDAVARGLQYGGVVGFFVAVAQEVSVLHSFAGALVSLIFLALVVGVVVWRVHHAKADPYGAISVRV